MNSVWLGSLRQVPLKSEGLGETEPDPPCLLDLAVCSRLRAQVGVWLSFHRDRTLM